MSTGDELQLLGRLMDVAVLSNQVHAANLANSNTPGYRAKAVSFDGAFQCQKAIDFASQSGAHESSPNGHCAEPDQIFGARDSYFV